MLFLPGTRYGNQLCRILELGAWFGVLINGILADRLGRKNATVVGVGVFLIGVIVQACATNKDYIFGGRFVTGIGVGVLSMIVPLYVMNGLYEALLMC